jgi:Endoplasmic Reticulum Oxidoreductin 1 (ERO1)
MIEKIKNINMTDTCTEETLLYQLVSGMHSSINMHVASNYIDFKVNSSHMYPNHARYIEAIGRYPERLKNLFFLYAVVLRAINRAEPILRSYEYQT